MGQRGETLHTQLSFLNMQPTQNQLSINQQQTRSRSGVFDGNQQEENTRVPRARYVENVTILPNTTSEENSSVPHKNKYRTISTTYLNLWNKTAP